MKWVALRTVCLAALVAGILWNLLFSIADLAARRNHPQSTRLAMRLMPANGAFAAQLADELYASDPAQAKSLLQRAVQRNPYDAASWIQLGLLWEADHDPPQAEKALSQAAAIDATFLPGWSLANFYFRQNRTDRFWYWAQRAAHMVPDDATALFRLAWYVSPNAPEIESRLQLRSPAIESQFVNFLVTQGDPKAVSQAASHLLAEPGTPDSGSTQTLLQACDWLLAQKRPDLALPLWNALAPRISYSPPAMNSPVTNGDFSRSPISRGFDWHLQTANGVTTFLNADPNALGFEFSGDEPDSLVLMSQVAPVQPQTDYALAIDYATAGIAPDTGITWQVTDEKTGAILARTGSLSAEPGGTAHACFTTPKATTFVNLALAYQRTPGTVRVEGKLTLKSVRLSADKCSGNKISLSSPDSPALHAKLKKQRAEGNRSST